MSFGSMDVMPYMASLRLSHVCPSRRYAQITESYDLNLGDVITYDPS